MPVIPPWLTHLPDLGEEYTRGLSIGAQISDTRQRLAAEQQRTAAEAQQRQDELKRQTLMEQQRIAVAQQYHQSLIDLKQQQLGEAQKMNAIKTRDAAMKLNQQQRFNQSLKDTGGDVMKSLYESGSATPQLAEEVQRTGDIGERAQETARHNREMERLGQARLDKTRTPAPVSVSALQTELKNVGDNPDKAKAIQKMIDARTGVNRQAFGKYKVGTIYKGGLKYLGGDPNDRDSWEKQ